MEMTLRLCLPRDALTVPVARRIVDVSMRAIGVGPESLSDVLVALTEASTNVLKHSGPGQEYGVTLQLDNERCTIEVRDLGVGFTPGAVSLDGADEAAERGRGFQLMQALMDEVHFESVPDDGTVVRLTKTLPYGEGSLLDRSITADSR